MPFEDFRKVLVRIKEKYDSHKIMVIVSGGEPLMDEERPMCRVQVVPLLPGQRYAPAR